MNGNEIKVLYFARVAEQTRLREERWPLSAPIQAAEWLNQLQARYPQLAPTRRLKVAINQYHVSLDSLIQPGDEVAVFEPVTGG